MESALPPSADRAVELFTPGRICLFGEHSDWAGTYRKFNSSIVPGRALCCGTQQGLFARARPHSALVVRSTANDGSVLSFECDMDPPTLLAKAQEGSFWSYAAGVAYEVKVHFDVGGLEIDNYRTTLPIKKGLSSSAAWCVLLARAFNRVYNLRMTTRGEMDIAYRGERCTPSQCGRLDQCCAFGSQLVSMTFNGDILETEAVQLHVPIYLLIIDLRKAKVTDSHSHTQQPYHIATAGGGHHQPRASDRTSSPTASRASPDSTSCCQSRQHRKSPPPNPLPAPPAPHHDSSNCRLQGRAIDAVTDVELIIQSGAIARLASPLCLLADCTIAASRAAGWNEATAAAACPPRHESS